MEEQHIIPIDSAIENFKLHLQSHPRTILSAKFGDGKTFFLNEFASNSPDYEVIRLCPVNYQVVDNKDIFELVKWDLMLQLSAKGILIDDLGEQSLPLTIQYCLKNHGLSLLESAADVVSQIPGADVFGKFAKSIMKLVKQFPEVVSAYNEYRSGNDDKLVSIINKIEKIPVLESDLLTQLIQKSIETWKKKEENKEKRMVLVFDDMDRIDPAHLFRILNVISAHMDYGYKFGVESCRELATCKFGVDNIVVVLDYDNLVKIYKHFYGPDTDVDGYIRKFLTNDYFQYSLKQEAVNHFYQSLCEELQLDENFVKKILNEDDICKKSIRDLMSSITDIDSQLVFDEGVGVFGIEKLMVVAKRLSISQYKIQNSLNGMLNDEHIMLFAKNVGWVVERYTNTHIVSWDNSYRALSVYIRNGKLEIKYLQPVPMWQSGFSVHSLVDGIFRHIS